MNLSLAHFLKPQPTGAISFSLRVFSSSERQDHWFGCSSRGKHLPLSRSKKEKIFKYWYNGVVKCVFVFSIASCKLYTLDHWKILDSTTTIKLSITPPTQQLSSKKIIFISDKSKNNLYNSNFKRSPKYIGNKNPNLMCAETTKITNY